MQRALAIVEQRMRECSSQSERCRKDGDDERMYKLNTAWQWLEAVRRDIEQASKK